MSRLFLFFSTPDINLTRVTSYGVLYWCFRTTVASVVWLFPCLFVCLFDVVCVLAIGGGNELRSTIYMIVDTFQVQFRSNDHRARRHARHRNRITSTVVSSK